jgi:hypothetical protein
MSRPFVGAFLLLALTSCGKPTLNPEAYAKGLLAHQDALAAQEFSIKVPMNCAKPGDPNASFAIKCRTILNDAARGGAPAVVDVQLYDHDVTFDQEIAPVKQQIADMEQRGDNLMSSNPDLSSEDKAGKKTVFQTSCHQVLGAKNSPAYCGMLVSPRVFVVSAVVPAEASTRQIVLSAKEGNDTDSGRDLRHGGDLAFLGLVLAGAVK